MPSEGSLAGLSSPCTGNNAVLLVMSYSNAPSNDIWEGGTRTAPSTQTQVKAEQQIWIRKALTDSD